METLANMQLVTNEISMKVNDIPDGEFKIIPKFTRSCLLYTSPSPRDCS